MKIKKHRAVYSLRRWKSDRLIYLILFAALAIRVAVYLELRHTPIITIPIADSYTYCKIAHQILQGNWLNNISTFTNPLYGYFVALTKYCFDFSTSDNFNSVLVLQCLLSLLTIYYSFLIVKNMFDSRTAMFTSLLISVYEILIFFDNTILSVSLINLLNTLMLFFIMQFEISGKKKFLLFSGLACGLSLVTRANLIIFVLFALIWIFTGSKRQITVFLQRAGLFLTGVLVFVALLTVRNYIETSEFITVSSNWGYNFYVGNNERANGTYVKPEFIHSTDQNFEEKESEQEASRRTGRQLTHSESSAYWFSQGVNFIWNNPDEYLSLMGKKLYLFFNNVETANNLSNYTARDYSTILKFSPSNFGIISALGLAGILLALRGKNRRFHLIVQLFILSYLLSSLIFMVASEYRAPLIMLLIAYAVYAIFELYRMLKTKHYLGPASISAAVILFTCWTNYQNDELKAYKSTGADYVAFGNQLLVSGNNDGALNMYLKAIVADSSDKLTNFKIAEVYYSKKDYVNALKYFQDSPNIERLPDKMKLDYIDSKAIYSYNSGQYADAAIYLRRLIAIDENYSRLNNLAACLIALDSLDEAEGILKKSVSMNSGYAMAYLNLARIFGKEGKTNEEIKNLEKFYEISPPEPSEELNLLKLYINAGMIDKANELGTKILRELPENSKELSELKKIFKSR